MDKIKWIEKKESKFKIDLATWLEYEKLVLEKLKSLWWDVEKNEDEKWVDLLLSSWEWIEVKRDNKSMETGNFYFETECYKKPSWIYKYDNVKFWIHWTEEKFHILDMEHIKGLIEQKGWWVSWWDWWLSRWKILPTSSVAKAAIISYDLIEDKVIDNNNNN